MEVFSLCVGICNNKPAGIIGFAKVGLSNLASTNRIAKSQARRSEHLKNETPLTTYGLDDAAGPHSANPQPLAAILNPTNEKIVLQSLKTLKFYKSKYHCSQQGISSLLAIVLATELGLDVTFSFLIRKPYMKIIYCIIFMLIHLFLSEVKAQERNDAQLFLSGLDSIRISLKIPGMAVAIKKEDSILLNDGLGYADLKNKIKVTTNTTFRIASITKTFTSTLIMQLVEQDKLGLQTPISKFGIDLGDPNITVKNLLTHTSEIEPGKYYQYNGYRYGKLGQVIEKVSGIPFYQLLMQNIVKPLNMNLTAPGLPLQDSLFDFEVYTKSHPEMLPFFENSFSHLAKAYDINAKGEIIETQYLDEFGAFGGLATNAIDLLKYSIAIDSNKFVSPKTQQEVFTPNRTTNGEMTPYGFGWFTQKYKGVDFYWHYGQTQGESGLFVKIPSMKLTLVVLTNSINLSSPFPLGDGDLLMSPVGQLFYKCFVNKDAVSEIDFSDPINKIQKEIKEHFKSEYKDFYNKEIISEGIIDNFKGDTASAKKLYDLYAELNFKNVQIRKYNSIMAQIKNVGINQRISKIFVLKKPTKIQITGIGENCSGDFKSWCDYGWIEDTDGKIIWQMQAQPAVSAGGAVKNQKVETMITLPEGTYILKYKSDSGHAYDYWDSLPPDNFIWGITLSIIN